MARMSGRARDTKVTRVARKANVIKVPGVTFWSFYYVKATSSKGGQGRRGCEGGQS